MLRSIDINCRTLSNTENLFAIKSVYGDRNLINSSFILPAHRRRYAMVVWPAVWQSVSLSQVGVLSRWMNRSSWFLMAKRLFLVSSIYPTLYFKENWYGVSKIMVSITSLRSSDQNCRVWKNFAMVHRCRNCCQLSPAYPCQAFKEHFYNVTAFVMLIGSGNHCSLHGDYLSRMMALHGLDVISTTTLETFVKVYRLCCAIMSVGEPFINLTASNMAVDEGQTQMLYVNVHSYPQQPTLTWFKDGQPFAMRSNGGR